MRKALTIISVVIAMVGGIMLGYSIVAVNWITFGIGAGIIAFAILLETLFGLIPVKNPPKNRTTFTFEANASPTKVEETIKQFLDENKFKPVTWNGETVYKRGGGFFAARKFISYKIDVLSVTVEAFISSGLGKAEGYEMPLDDNFYGSFPKNKLKKTVSDLGNKLKALENKNPQ